MVVGEKWELSLSRQELTDSNGQTQSDLGDVSLSSSHSVFDPLRRRA